MLYNPEWNKDVRYSVFDREDFIKWLGEQPANKTYTYTNPYRCAVAQYLAARGCDRVSSGPGFERNVGVLHIVSQRPFTFGAAYDRATNSTKLTRFFRRIFGR